MPKKLFRNQPSKRKLAGKSPKTQEKSSENPFYNPSLDEIKTAKPKRSKSMDSSYVLQVRENSDYIQKMLHSEGIACAKVLGNSRKYLIENFQQADERQRSDSVASEKEAVKLANFKEAKQQVYLLKEKVAALEKRYKEDTTEEIYSDVFHIIGVDPTAIGSPLYNIYQQAKSQYYHLKLAFERSTISSEEIAGDSVAVEEVLDNLLLPSKIEAFDKQFSEISELGDFEYNINSRASLMRERRDSFDISTNLLVKTFHVPKEELNSENVTDEPVKSQNMESEEDTLYELNNLYDTFDARFKEVPKVDFEKLQVDFSQLTFAEEQTHLVVEQTVRQQQELSAARSKRANLQGTGREKDQDVSALEHNRQVLLDLTFLRGQDEFTRQFAVQKMVIDAREKNRDLLSATARYRLEMKRDYIPLVRKLEKEVREVKKILDSSEKHDVDTLQGAVKKYFNAKENLRSVMKTVENYQKKMTKYEGEFSESRKLAMLDYTNISKVDVCIEQKKAALVKNIQQLEKRVTAAKLKTPSSKTMSKMSRGH